MGVVALPLLVKISLTSVRKKCSLRFKRFSKLHLVTLSNFLPSSNVSSEVIATGNKNKRFVTFNKMPVFSESGYCWKHLG